jgi:AraC-like DNA-binding protein
MKTIIDISLIMNGAFGFICAIFLFYTLKSNRFINIYLAIMVLGISFRLVLKGYLELTGQFDIILETSKNNIHLLMTSFPYLYFKTIFNKNSKFNYKTLYHFLLPILLISLNRINFFTTLYGNNTQNLFLLTIVLLYSYYVVRIILLLKVNVWKKLSAIESAEKQNIELKKWVTLLFIAFFLMWIRLIISLIVSYNNNGDVSDNIFFWMNSIVWFFVFVKIVTNHKLLTSYYSVISKEKKIDFNRKEYSNNWKIKPLTEITNKQDIQLSLNLRNSLVVIFKEIDAALAEDNFFRVSGFSIIDLANKLNIPKSHLAHVFKYHSKLSFSDFKKKVRINDCINLVQSNYLKQNTFESLAKEVGFATYNTFFISFKEVTGKAPNQYISDLQTTKK